MPLRRPSVHARDSSDQQLQIFPVRGTAAMIEFLLDIAGVILFAVIAGRLGVEYTTVEAIAAILFGGAVLWVAARSAYRDACRRQRWPGKNLETRNALSKTHDATSSSPLATNR
jgi:hypothetical protein